MKNIILTLLFTISSTLFTFAQNLKGVYIAKKNDVTHLILATAHYITHTSYSKDGYENTQGGTYRLENNNLIVHCEFDDKSSESVARAHIFPIKIVENSIQIDDLSFNKQIAIPQELDGLWRITGRKNKDIMQTIQRGDRKTIKILVDGYFQWIAINPAEKGFYGTGGGKYTFKNNQYQEDILFFSRDNNKVGVTLNFEGKIENQQWHHSGRSSKGDPIFEIWSREK